MFHFNSFFRREDRILRRCTAHKMIGKVKPELTTSNKYKAVQTLSRELPLELEVVIFLTETKTDEDLHYLQNEHNPPLCIEEEMYKSDTISYGHTTDRQKSSSYEGHHRNKKHLVLSLSPQKYNPASASFSGDGFSCGQLLKVSKRDAKFLKSERTGESQLNSSAFES